MRIAPHWLRHSLAVAAVAPVAACNDDSPVGPEAALATAAVDLGACDSLRVPAGSQLAFHAYAEGAGLYQHWGRSCSR
jgi:hypothetical protein